MLNRTTKGTLRNITGVVYLSRSLPGTFGLNVARPEGLLVQCLWRKVMIAFNNLCPTGFGDDSSIPNGLDHGRAYSVSVLSRSKTLSCKRRPGLVKHLGITQILKRDGLVRGRPSPLDYFTATMASISERGATPPCPPAIRSGATPNFFMPS